MKPPADAFEMLHDQHLKTFHKGRICNLGLNKNLVDTAKFRDVCAGKPGLAPYIAYKRAETRNKEGVATILSTRASKSSEAKERGLIKYSRSKYNNSTPHAGWNRMFGSYPAKVRKGKVYGNYIQWKQDDEKGMLLPHFLIMWPLVFCGHVDGLNTQEERDKWQDIFVDDAAEKLGNMVKYWKWDELD